MIRAGRQGDAELINFGVVHEEDYLFDQVALCFLRYRNIPPHAYSEGGDRRAKTRAVKKGRTMESFFNR